MTLLTKSAVLFKLAFLVFLTYEKYIYFHRNSYLMPIDIGLLFFSFLNLFLSKWNGVNCALNLIFVFETLWRIYSQSNQQLIQLSGMSKEEVLLMFYRIAVMYESITKDFFSFIWNIKNMYDDLWIFIVRVFSLISLLMALLITFLHQWIEVSEPQTVEQDQKIPVEEKKQKSE